MRNLSVSAGPVATAAAAALAVVAAVAAPANAAAATFVDGDDSEIKADVEKVRVVHRADRVKVKVFFDDLVEDPLERSQGVSVYFDTDTTDRGPEFRLGGGLNSGTDYQLSRVESWSSRGRSLRHCDYHGRISWTRDVVTYLVDPSCFDEPEGVAVGVKSGESSSGAGERYDWLGEEKSLTTPVTRD